jgi:hypothetical protein
VGQQACTVIAHWLILQEHSAMSTTHFSLDDYRLVTPALVNWYNQAAIGDAAVIDLPTQATTVRLLRSPNRFVHWWPLRTRGVTVPFEDALQRLRMLSDTGDRLSFPVGACRLPGHAAWRRRDY